MAYGVYLYYLLPFTYTGSDYCFEVNAVPWLLRAPLSPEKWINKCADLTWKFILILNDQPFTKEFSSLRHHQSPITVIQFF